MCVYTGIHKHTNVLTNDQDHFKLFTPISFYSSLFSSFVSSHPRMVHMIFSPLLLGSSFSQFPCLTFCQTAQLTLYVLNTYNSSQCRYSSVLRICISLSSQGKYSLHLKGNTTCKYSFTAVVYEMSLVVPSQSHLCSSTWLSIISSYDIICEAVGTILDNSNECCYFISISSFHLIIFWGKNVKIHYWRKWPFQHPPLQLSKEQISMHAMYLPAAFKRQNSV